MGILGGNPWNISLSIITWISVHIIPKTQNIPEILTNI